jgi:hypothetical protein
VRDWRIPDKINVRKRSVFTNGGRLTVTLEVLHVALVFLGSGARSKRSKIPAPAGLRIGLSGIQAITA